MSRQRVASAAVALTLLLVGCGGGSTTSSTASTVSGNDEADEVVEVGPALEGVFPTVAGGQVDLGALEGQDTVLWFWAPW